MRVGKNKQHQVLIDNIPGAVTEMRYDGGLVIEYANDMMYDLMQISKDDFAKKYENHYDRTIYSKDWLELKQKIENAIKHNTQVKMEFRVYTGKGAMEWRLVMASILEERRDGVILQCVISDITDAKMTQLELEKEREKLKAVVRMSGDMIFEYDIEADHMVYTNSGDDLLFFREITQNYTKNLYELIKAEDAEAGRRLAEAMQAGQEYFSVELRRLGTDGQYRWVSVTGKTLYDKEGNPEKILGKIRNIDEQKQKEKELQDKSQKDSLTGLYNHMTAKNMMSENIAHLGAGQTAYLIICDIDNFKTLNDTNGHMFGDVVLCSFSDELITLLPEAIIGRIGGDEFLAYVENIERSDLEARLVELNEFMSDRFSDDITEVRISCSLGAVEIDGSVRDFDTLFQWADNALYRIKSRGKGSHLILKAEPGVVLPQNTYLDSERNRDMPARKETLITTGEELVLFCVEILENVPNVKSALKMIGERTCSFFGLDDMVCVEHPIDGEKTIYQWNKHDKKKYIQRMYNAGVYEWDILLNKTDKQGVILYGVEQTAKIETEDAKSVMMVFSKELKDYRGSVIFADRNKDRDWIRERDTLLRIANHIFVHLRYLKLGELERKEMDRKLNYDVLTGLPVYNRFVKSAEEYLAANSSKDLYCVYSDFSNFQYFNELYGYEAGDGVLRDFAKLLEAYEAGIMFCRVTSDYFLGFLKGPDAKTVSDDYLGYVWGFTEKINAKYDQCNLVIATGVYQLKEEDTNIASMMDNANEARKKCKEQKVATAVTIYTDSIRQQVESTKEIVANIVAAYNNNEFVAYLQPKVSLATGRVVGAEALVRWIKPDGSIVMPGQFIDISEKNGFITKIDFAVLDCVMKYLREALDLGEEVVPVSVNFSRRNNEFEKFVPSVVKRLEQYNIPSHLLEAELTESVFTADLDGLSKKIESLRGRGIEVSVDDFGSGYSSLNLLSKVSVDTIKLDRQFLTSTMSNAQEETSLTIIKYLIKMLKHLGFKVLAEGVETKEQLEMLKRADCDIAQGYYYAKPMPISEFREYLRKFNREEV